MSRAQKRPVASVRRAGTSSKPLSTAWKVWDETDRVMDHPDAARGDPAAWARAERRRVPAAVRRAIVPLPPLLVARPAPGQARPAAAQVCGGCPGGDGGGLQG